VFAARKRCARTRITFSAKCGVRLTRNRNCFSPTGTTVASVAATTVALRGLWSINAISPKMLSRIEQAVAEANFDLSALDDE
jgi:hypothetical protein